MIALYDVQPDPSMGVQYRMLELEWSAPTENTAPIDGYKILFRKDEVPARLHLTAPLHQLAICVSLRVSHIQPPCSLRQPVIFWQEEQTYLVQGAAGPTGEEGTIPVFRSMV